MPSLLEIWLVLERLWLIAVNTTIGCALGGPSGALVGAGLGAVAASGGVRTQLVASLANVILNVLPHISRERLNELVRFFMERARSLLERIGLIESSAPPMEISHQDRFRGPPQH